MRNRAFTYIELLIVVSVISVLAAITVPNFLMAQVRAKVARARADMATIVIALEAYHAETRAYPPNHAWMDEILVVAELPGRDLPMTGTILEDVTSQTYRARYGGGYDYRSAGHHRHYRAVYPHAVYEGRDVSSLLRDHSPLLVALTTPLAHMASLDQAVDTFALSRGDPLLYVNWSEAAPGGLPVWPGGPRMEFALICQGPDSQLEIAYPTNIGYVPYDPTNGTTSYGEIVVTSR
jgi:prepilin-type N-terminal cleavage/methylation domain-containing protein